MKKLILIATILGAVLLCSFQLDAQTRRQANAPVLVERNGNELNPKIIEFENGRYKYSMDGTGFLIKNRGEIRYAWIPKPKEISEADALMRTNSAANNTNALSKLLPAAEKYKFLGWEPYARMKAAEVYQRMKQINDAIKTLEVLMQYKNDDFSPRNEADYRAAQKLLGTLYIEKGDYDKAVGVADAMATASDDVSGCSAYLLKGDALMKKVADAKDKRAAAKAAAMAYFQAALLFQEKGGKDNHAEALLKCYETLKYLSDSRADAFSKELKEKYPDFAAKNLK